MDIRDFQISDVNDLCSILNNELGYKNIEITTLKSQLDCMEKNNSYYTKVALIDDKVVGFIGMVILYMYEGPSTYIKINALGVKKSFQKKGIGKRLLKNSL